MLNKMIRTASWFLVIAVLAIAVPAYAGPNDPPANPPTCPTDGSVPGCFTPLNVSGYTQTKSGNLNIQGSLSAGTTTITKAYSISGPGTPAWYGVYKPDVTLNLTTGKARTAEQGGSIGFSDGTSFLYGAIKGGATNSTVGQYGGYLGFFTTGPASGGPYEKMRITEVGDIGIGTNVPGAKLDIKASGYLAGDALRISKYNSTDYWDTRVENSNSALVFKSSAIDNVLALLNDGKVGVGLTNPSEKFEVNGKVISSGASADFCTDIDNDGTVDANVDKCLSTVGGGNNTNLPAGTAGQTLRHNGTTWVADSNLYNNGTNVGIGTAAPAQQLQVGAITDTTNNVLRIATGNGTAAFPALSFFRSGKIDGVLVMNDGTLQYAINPTYTSAGFSAATKFAIDANGKVRIAGGSPAANKVLAADDVNGNASWKTISEICPTCGSGTTISGTANRLSMFNATGNGLVNSPLYVQYTNRLYTDSELNVNGFLKVGRASGLPRNATSEYDGDDLNILGGGPGSDPTADWSIDVTGGDLRFFTSQAPVTGAVAMEIKPSGQVQLKYGSPAAGKILVSDDAEGSSRWETLGNLIDDRVQISTSNTKIYDKSRWIKVVATCPSGTVRISCSSYQSDCEESDCGNHGVKPITNGCEGWFDNDSTTEDRVDAYCLK